MKILLRLKVARRVDQLELLSVRAPDVLRRLVARQQLVCRMLQLQLLLAAALLCRTLGESGGSSWHTLQQHDLRVLTAVIFESLRMTRMHVAREVILHLQRAVTYGVRSGPEHETVRRLWNR